MTMYNNGVTTLDAVLQVQFDIRASDLSGKVERSRDLPTVDMPPANLVSAGVRHFCDPSLKKPFNTLRKAAERACAEVGVPLMKGWAIPKDKAKGLDTVLRKLKADFERKADELQADLPRAYREWEEANPGWEELLRRDRPDPGAVRSRYRFRHVVYQMRPAADDADDPLNEGLGITRGSLLEAILDDVAARSSDILAKTFEGKAQVSGRLVTTIAVLATKLRSFELVDPLVTPVAIMIGEVLAAIGHTTGTLSVSETSSLRGLLGLLSDPVKVRRHGALSIQGADLVVDEPLAEPTVVTQSEEVDHMPPPPALVRSPSSAVLI